MIRRLLAVSCSLAALAVIALVLTAGGGSKSATDPNGSAYGATPSATKAATSTVGSRHTKLGRILVDARSRSLYVFEKDTGAMSSCDGACASVWPPLTTGANAKAATGVTAAKLATTKRSDGKTQVTYDGHPLYTYAGDHKPGDVQGQGLDQFGAEWYAVAPNGHKVDND